MVPYNYAYCVGGAQFLAANQSACGGCPAGDACCRDCSLRDVLWERTRLYLVMEYVPTDLLQYSRSMRGRLGLPTIKVAGSLSFRVESHMATGQSIGSSVAGAVCLHQHLESGHAWAHTEGTRTCAVISPYGLPALSCNPASGNRPAA